MSQETRNQPRLSIEERAARRARIESPQRDRYGSLVRALQAGRQIPLREAPRARIAWHPIARLLTFTAIAGALLWALGTFAFNAWRDAQVDTWSGPDSAVASGQRLAGCDSVNQLHDDLLPTWVRYHGTVYGITQRKLTVREDGREGLTGLPESGYSLGSARILLPTDHTTGEPAHLLLVRPPAYVGRVFLPLEECA